MIPPNDDWDTLCLIYNDGEDEHDFGGTEEESQKEDDSFGNNDDRRVKLEVSAFSKGFCGTVYMTLSTSKIAFARLVKSDGSYRCFTIDKPPVLQLDLLYFTRKSNANILDEDEGTPIDDDHNDDNGDDDDYDDDDDDDWSEADIAGPSNLRLTWKYYPTEWPLADKEKYRSSLAKKCHSILREEGSFSVCQFLEHKAISFYYGNHTADATGATADEGDTEAPVTNASNSWKTYADDDHPDYLLVILPPKMDQLYYPTVGSLLHPREEAALLEEAAAKKKANAARASGSKTTTASKKKAKKTGSKTTSSVARIDNTLDFGRHALLQNWKDLYMTKCPICLEESVLYSDGVVFPYCQHYCCRDCFDLYLRYKVQDLKEHRTNPFLCPVETCQRELPMTFCKQFLSDEDIAAAKAWYKDLKNPPAWSLDRCPLTKTCGAVGSMRRRKSVISIDAQSGKTKQQTASSSSSSSSSNPLRDLQYLVYCDSCKKTWCELCLERVYDDEQCTPVGTKTSRAKPKPKPSATARQKSTVSTHSRSCNPKPMLRFCRKYAAASEQIRAAVRARYPWIVSYSQFCEQDGAALQYVLDHGQRCPNCQTGVERTEGCFHMKCPACATHFCYECGTELFPPYYGTHHCWEDRANGGGDDEDDDGDGEVATGAGNNAHGINLYEMDEQLAAALQWMGND